MNIIHPKPAHIGYVAPHKDAVSRFRALKKEADPVAAIIARLSHELTESP